MSNKPRPTFDDIIAAYKEVGFQPTSGVWVHPFDDKCCPIGALYLKAGGRRCSHTADHWSKGNLGRSWVVGFLDGYECKERMTESVFLSFYAATRSYADYCTAHDLARCVRQFFETGNPLGTNLLQATKEKWLEFLSLLEGPTSASVPSVSPTLV